MGHRDMQHLGDEITCLGPGWGMGARAGTGYLEEDSKGHNHVSFAYTIENARVKPMTSQAGLSQNHQHGALFYRIAPWGPRL